MVGLGGSEKVVLEAADKMMGRLGLGGQEWEPESGNRGYGI